VKFSFTQVATLLEGAMADVFISYSRKDKEFAHRLQEALVEHEREPWLDTQDIPPTAEWLQEIYGAIEKADSFVFVISPDVLGSQVCQLELAHAVKHHKRLIPVVRRDVDPKDVPDLLARLNWIFCREEDDFPQSFQVLLTAMATDLDHVRAHTRLLLKALEWEGRGQDKSLLLRGGELKRSEEWLATSRDREPEPTPLMVQFLLAGRKAATVRQRLTLSSVSFALVVTLALAVATYFLYREAGSQKESALARGLTAQSELLRSQQPHLLDRSVLLAVESLRRRITLEGNLALQRGLALLPKRLSTMSVEQKFGRISVSPDGKWVAGWTSFEDEERGPGKAWLWEAETGRLAASLPEEKTRYLLVAFSPDSRRLTTLTDEGGLRVTSVPDGRELSRISLTLNFLAKVALSPDGNLLAAGGKGRQVFVYDVKTGRELVRLPYTGYLVKLIFTPDSAKLAVIYDNALQLWQVPAGVSLGRFKDLEHHIEELAVSPDGQYLAAGTGEAPETDETRVPVCDLSTGRVMARLPRKGVCYALGFSQTGLLMTRTSDGVIVWRPRDAQEVFRVKPPSGNDAALSPSGRWLAVGVGEHAVQVYDLTTGREAKRLTHANLAGIVFSPDSRWLFTNGRDGAVKWQIDGFEEVLGLAHPEYPWDTAEFQFSPDGRLLATGDPAQNRVKVWETGAGRLLYDLDRFAIREGGSRKGLVHGSSYPGWFSPDGQWLAMSLSYMDMAAPSNGKKMVGVYHMATGKLMGRIGDLEEFTAISFQPDSRALITTDGGRRRKVWDLATGKLLETIPGPALPPHLKEEITAFSPDGKWFCGAGEDQVQKVWEVATGREAFRLGPAWQIFREDGRETKIENYPHIIFSPTGQYLSVVAVKGSLRKDNIKELPKEVLIWEVASSRQVASVAQPTKFTLPVFSPPGNTLAVAAQENLVHLIDLAGGRELARLKHEGEVRGMSFSSDGQWLATGGKDNTARIWEVSSGREAARLDHPNVVNRVGFSPDSRRLATSCEDFQVRLWHWRTADLVAAACGRLPRNLTREEWREYLGNEPYRATCPNLPALPPKK
jgi:WD40 repeat protein